jgi:hypothetical protein
MDSPLLDDHFDPAFVSFLVFLALILNRSPVPRSKTENLRHSKDRQNPRDLPGSDGPSPITKKPTSYGNAVHLRSLEFRLEIAFSAPQRGA